jgi:hypothetical protein
MPFVVGDGVGVGVDVAGTDGTVAAVPAARVAAAGGGAGHEAEDQQGGTGAGQ